MIFRDAAQNVVKFVGEKLGIAIEDAEPVDPLDLLEFLEQLGQPGPAVKVDAVISHVLCDQDQLAHAVGGEFLSFGDNHLDRLGHMLAAHERDGAERAKAIAPFGDFKVGEVSGSDPQPCAVVLGLNRGGPEEPALLGKPAQQPVGNSNDLFAAEDADDIIDIGKPLEQRVFLAFGQAAGDDDCP